MGNLGFRVCGLRYDYLSSLLCHADVRSGARFLVLDNAAGLVTGAVALQLGGAGEVFRAFRGPCPEKDTGLEKKGDRVKSLSRAFRLALQHEISIRW
ncbi:tRNA (adenine(58)-N(1))-methyltransferase non-catalytic subunit trm6 [Symbiodinium microadriaticum]|uniref:tRNA (adenine(58)-N(1))-methyltransferase non-catalytic subunit TRM6 n=1 Tax=Symbiodinium microadriaticum TaxID=2951 RepID=A0A1Q9DVR7_SYMMI|nr:tRNA (adenine(58)-N(1))-methyltransferase non-catalytic subunit trm6 [Symbiodinium microadriaticum]